MKTKNYLLRAFIFAIVAIGFSACGSGDKGNNTANPYGGYNMNGNNCMNPQGQIVDQSFCYNYGNTAYHMNGNTCVNQQQQPVDISFCNNYGGSYGGYYPSYPTYPSYGNGGSYGGYCYYILGYMKCKQF